MQKTINVCGEDIVLKTNGFVPILYKKEFKRDFFKDIQAMSEDDYDKEILYNLVWIYAKIADKEIGDFDEWLSSFEAFPIFDYITDIIEMTTACITSKSTKKKKTAASR